MRLLLGVLCSAAALLTFAPAGPAAAADPPCTRLAGQQSLSDSRWTGPARWNSGETNNWTLWLRPDCVAVYSYGGPETYTNGRWVQRGNMVVIEVNDYFATYVGHQNAGQLNGVMYNQRGVQGSWSFRRTD